MDAEVLICEGPDFGKIKYKIPYKSPFLDSRDYFHNSISKFTFYRLKNKLEKSGWDLKVEDIERNMKRWTFSSDLE